MIGGWIDVRAIAGTGGWLLAIGLVALIVGGALQAADPQASITGALLPIGFTLEFLGVVIVIVQSVIGKGRALRRSGSTEDVQSNERL